MFDEAMFVREMRRYRDVGGWVGGIAAMALWFLIALPLFTGPPTAGSAALEDWGVGLAGVLGCLMAFTSAAGVLRREAAGHTLESLLVTCQNSRQVVTSIAAAGALRGVLLLVLTLITLLIAGPLNARHTAGLLAAFVLLAICQLAAASLGVVLSMVQNRGGIVNYVSYLGFIPLFCCAEVNTGRSAIVSVFPVFAPAAASIYFIIREWAQVKSGSGDRLEPLATPTGRRASIGSFFLTGILLAGFALADWQFTGARFGSIEWLFRANPFVAAARLGGEWQNLANMSQLPAVLLLAMQGLFVTAGLVCYGTRRYRQLRNDPGAINRLADPAKISVRGEPARPWRCGTNPVLSREVRCWVTTIRFTAGLTGATIFVGLVLGAVLKTSVKLNHCDFPAVVGMTVLFCGIILPAVLALLADAHRPASIGQERELGMLEMLLSTSLTAREILIGKLAGSLAPMVVFAIPSVAAFLTAMLFGYLAWPVGLTSICLTLSFSLTISMLYVCVPVLVRRAWIRHYLQIGALPVYGVVWGISAIVWSFSGFAELSPWIEAAWVGLGPLLLTGISALMWQLSVRRLRSGGAL